MAKHPAPGRVKTRLAAAVGSRRACALYRAFVLDLRDRLRVLRWPVVWAFWPARAPFAALVPGAVCLPQRGADLGERLASAIAAVAGHGAGRVVVIGADVPHVPRARLEEAARALRAGADVVLGPADDGGYYLIALAAPRPQLFTGIPWGTAEVFATTQARARRLGLRVRVLAPVFDVDEPADLARLATLLARGRVRLPRTRAALAACGRFLSS
jgi:hypothetical protein